MTTCTGTSPTENYAYITIYNRSPDGETTPTKFIAARSAPDYKRNANQNAHKDPPTVGPPTTSKPLPMGVASQCALGQPTANNH